MLRNRKSRRRGVSSLEYVGVCALICIVAISAIVVLGRSVAGLNRVSNTFASSGVPAEEINDSLGHTTKAEASGVASEISQLQIFSALSAICIVALGILHLSGAKKPKEEDLQPQTCDVRQIEKQSKALQTILSKRSSVQSILLEDWVQLFEGNAQVGTYMSREVAAVRPDMTIEDADRMLREDGFRRVMVTHEDGRMAGVLSRKDIASKQGAIVADIMTDAPKTASPDMNVRIALSILLQHRISCLPVVKDGILIGLISTSDLLIVLQCILLILSNQKEKAADVMKNSQQPVSV